MIFKSLLMATKIIPSLKTIKVSELLKISSMELGKIELENGKDIYIEKNVIYVSDNSYIFSMSNVYLDIYEDEIRITSSRYTNIIIKILGSFIVNIYLTDGSKYIVRNFWYDKGVKYE